MKHMIATKKGVLGALCSKCNKDARLVEREVCFILDKQLGAGEQGTPVQRLPPCTDSQ